MSKASLKFYRKVIGDAWLPLVKRRRLTSSEYAFTQQLFESSIEIELVLKAIQKCAERARRKGNTIYSLGVIKNDLEAVMKEKSRMSVGAANTAGDNAWRDQWHRDLEDLISQVDEPYRDAYLSLLLDLDVLSRGDAQQRWDAIQKLEK